MIAVDTNILVYAHRADSPWQPAAARRLTELADSGRAWAIPWPCVHEFLAIVTHPRIYRPPSPFADAARFLDQILASPSLSVLGEASGYWTTLTDLLRRGSIVGPQVHDARIAAICIYHGVDELWSNDRDFSRMPGLRVRNPLLGH